MLSAEQLKRRLLARFIPAVYLLLVLSVFGGPGVSCPENGQNNEYVLDAGQQRTEALQAILPAAGKASGEYMPYHSPRAAFVFANPTLYDVFFTQHGQLQKPAPPLSGTKRYLLFSCLRLGDAPPVV